MSDNHISVHVRHNDPKAVTTAVSDIFSGAGYGLLKDQSVEEFLASDESLEEDIYGFVVTGATQDGWITVYVDDWVDSGLIAKTISGKLDVWIVETWLQDEGNWGYTLYNNGEILDRFTDDPYALTDDPNEAALYTGNHEAFAPILVQPAETLKNLLDQAQIDTSEANSTKSVALFAESVGIPFEHALIGLEDFFDVDPEDYIPDLENWPAFRFLTFRHPEGKSTLVS